MEHLSHTCLLDGDETLQWRTKTDGGPHLCVSSRGGLNGLCSGFLPGRGDVHGAESECNLFASNQALL